MMETAAWAAGGQASNLSPELQSRFGGGILEFDH